MERQVRAEVVEARQLAAAMQASREQASVGNQAWVATEGDDDIDEQFRELCDAAGVIAYGLREIRNQGQVQLQSPHHRYRTQRRTRHTDRLTDRCI
jgi:predicted phage gp36 major capsid-like protein